MWGPRMLNKFWVESIGIESFTCSFDLFDGEFSFTECNRFVRSVHTYVEQVFLFYYDWQGFGLCDFFPHRENYSTCENEGSPPLGRTPKASPTTTTTTLRAGKVEKARCQQNTFFSLVCEMTNSSYALNAVSIRIPLFYD